jgi:hypothetical protein
MITVRKGDLFLAYLAILVLFLLGALAHSSYEKRMAEPWLKEKKELVKNLELTDLCFFTEANYTRHLSQADFHVPFQDHPASFDHFPSGSLLPPPATIRGTHGPLD